MTTNGEKVTDDREAIHPADRRYFESRTSWSCPVSLAGCDRPACSDGCGYIGNWPPPVGRPL